MSDAQSRGVLSSGELEALLGVLLVRSNMPLYPGSIVVLCLWV